MAGIIPAIEAHERDKHAADSSLKYMPGLDVVRGLAILSVLAYHGLGVDVSFYASANSSLANKVLHFFDLGHFGVHLFFVLSGFLITGILLESRQKPDYYKSFYIRRALRILPASFLLLAVLRAIHRISWPFLLAAFLYLANMSKIFHTTTEYGSLWSLSVEEQFYLFWPLIVRKCSRPALVYICVAIVVLTPLLRFILLFGSPQLRDISFKTWVVSDFFAAGALLAIGVRMPELRATLHILWPWLTGTGLFLVAVYYTMRQPKSVVLRNMYAAVLLEPWLLLCTGLVLVAFLYPSIASGRTVRPLIFLANISYGLYLCHALIFEMFTKRWRVTWTGPIHSWAMFFSRFLVESILAIGIAWLSRSTYEEFFLRLKPKPQTRVPAVNIA